MNFVERIRRRKIITKSLTVMVCGRPGTGKTTFITSLCENELDSEPERPLREGLGIRTSKIDVVETDGTVISLSIVETPGFGEHINNSHEAETIKKYLESQFEAALHEEALVYRDPHFQDNRVHVCLYFLPPSGHLRELDIDAMNTLSARVNVIPVIGKADTLSETELQDAKQRIMHSLRTVPIFSLSFLYSDDEDDEESHSLHQVMPFAVVGSTEIYQVDDELIRGRRYPWGLVRVYDPQHSDFVALRSVLFDSHLQELRESTIEQKYEEYRRERLSEERDLFERYRREEDKKTLSRAEFENPIY